MRRFGTLTSADAQPALGQRAVEFFTDPADRAVAQFRSSEQAVSVGGAWPCAAVVSRRAAFSYITASEGDPVQAAAIHGGTYIFAKAPKLDL
jgi:hypothetical protein